MPNRDIGKFDRYRGIVNRFRLQLRAYPSLVALLLAVTLALRVLVPAGFMPAIEHGRIVITLCTGVGPATSMMAMPGMDHHSDRPGQAKSPCAFADLSLPAIGGADPIQLVRAIVYMLALGLVLTVIPPIRGPARLRPPLRGPPLTA